MILILSSNTDQQSADYLQLMACLTDMHGIKTRVHVKCGRAVLKGQLAFLSGACAASRQKIGGWRDMPSWGSAGGCID